MPRSSRTDLTDRPWPPRPAPRARPKSPPRPPAPARPPAARAAPPPAPPAHARAAPPRPARGGALGWRLLRWGIIGAVWSAVALAVLLLIVAWDLPRPETAAQAVRRPSLTLEARDGRVLATYGDVVGATVHLSGLPPALPEAVVAIEDRRFWWHPGIDPIGIARAAWTNLRAGHTVQGGSTLTQQVAKNLFLTNARTFRRKVQEVLLTLWLERHFTKRQILEIWLNRIYLGAGAWGVDAAAQIYFGIPASRLNLWQSAMIAGLARAPSRFNPRSSPSAATARTREVLAAMVATGAITQAQADTASAQIAFPPRGGGDGWFADWIADRAEAVVPEGADAVLRTTLDPALQARAQRALDALLDGPGRAADVGEGAVIVLDAATGAVRAMVGGHAYADSPYNRAVMARRQPGSAFKPFVWLTALEDGMTPQDRVEDAPIRVGSWSPVNFEHRFLGPVTLEDALAQSLNTVSVRLLLAHGGARAVIATARRLGITSRLPANASLALGTGEVGVLELAAAYAPFFNGGMRVTPYGIEQLRLAGRPGPVAHTAPARVIDATLSREMAAMLDAVVARGSGRAAAIPGRAAGGKTGTTQDSRDAWFVGGTGGLIIAVWMGNDDDHPMHGVMGGGLPARLFHDIAAGG